MFSEVSKNWAGQPLESYETIINYLRTTTTATGLKVKAHLLDRLYRPGVKVTDQQLAALSITRHDVLPQWNYTLTPING